jgi:hypothetical protein
MAGLITSLRNKIAAHEAHYENDESEMRFVSAAGPQSHPEAHSSQQAPSARQR